MANSKNESLGAIVCALAIIINVGCYGYSRTMPYLFNEKNILSSFYIIFPLVLMFFIYFVYFYKWQVSGQTSFQMRFSKKELADPYFKAKQMLFAWAGIILFSAGLAWSTWGIPASVAYFYSKKPIIQEFVVNNLKGRGNTGVDVGLVDKANGIEYSLKQPGYLSLGVPWNIGDTVCAKGRTSFFGTIVEDFKVGKCE